MYCFVSGGDVHCVPVEEDTSIATTSTDTPQAASNGSKNGTNGTLNGDISLMVPPQNLLKIRNKNLIYSLNDPSISDFESAGENDTSINEDDEDEDDDDDDEDEDTQTQNGRATTTTASIKKSLYLPQFTVDLPTNLAQDFAQVKQLLTSVFPWIISPNEITVKELTGGITNMLLSCKHTPSGFTALMRVYGQGTNLIIDRHREFVLQLILNSLNLAPPIFARFSNGLVYGFLPGRSLQPEELQNEKLYPLIAQQLGIWHNRISGEDIDEGVEKLRKITISLKKQHSGDGRPSMSRSSSRRRLLLLTGNHPRIGHNHPKKSISFVWELIEDWMNIVPIIPGLIESFQENDDLRDNKTELNVDTTRSIVQAEFEWLRTELTEKSKSPIVSCHCDLLSGNIIIPEDFLTSTTPPTQNPVQFIDYEYMLSGPRAFDIANHLAEWQGFNCDRSAIPLPTPSNPVMVKWVQGYLNKPNATKEEVEEVIEEISMFYGMPGFYWGIWAMIQSEISTIDFDYANYGKLRFQEYWDWKKDYLSKTL